jgi:hypothetical protein
MRRGVGTRINAMACTIGVLAWFSSSAEAAPPSAGGGGAPPTLPSAGGKGESTKVDPKQPPRGAGPLTTQPSPPAAPPKPAPVAVPKPGAVAAPKPAPAAPAKPKAAQQPAAQQPAKPSPEQPVALAEVAELRAEVKALRDELTRVVGAPATQADPERERLSTELAEEKRKLAAIQAAVEGGLERSAVADSIARAETRIAELESALARLPQREAMPSPPSLYEVAREVDGMKQKQAPASPPLPEGPAPTASAEAKHEEAVAGGKDRDFMEKMGLLPLDFTAFGDFFYRWERPGADDFHVGAVELDASLKLTPYVTVSTAIVFDGEEDAFGLGAFVIDCGIAGDGDGYVVQSKPIAKSGVSFGRFDVPFGIAYLQYPSVENRLVTLPQAVQLTHGAWNDVGAQGYVVGAHWTAVGYVVNGLEHPLRGNVMAPARSAAGGRVSGKIDDAFEIGASAALDFASEGPVMGLAGGDLQGTLGPLNARGEYLVRHVKVEGLAELTHGVYGQALLRLEPAFLVGRYDTVLEGSATLDRRVTGGAGVEVFPQGEVRAVYERSLVSDLQMVTLQLVGGSSFQPTGLRR